MSTPNKPGGRALFTPCRRIGLSRNYKSPVLSPRGTQIEDNPTSSTPISNISINNSPILSGNRRMGLSRNYKKLMESPAAASEKPKMNEKLNETYAETNPCKRLDLSKVCRSPIIDSPKNTSIKELRRVSNEKLSESCADTNSFSTPCKRLGLSKVCRSPIIDSPKNTSIKELRKVSNIYNDLLNVCKTPPNKKLSLVSSDPVPTQLDSDDLVPAALNSKELKEEFKVYPSPSDSKIIKRSSRLSLKRSNDDKIDLQEIENLRCDVEQLDGVVKKKEETLSKLQRCAVYKQSQDLSTLTTLTETWKNGCELALRRIFTNFKGSSDVNMDTLLVKLKVPKDILQYHSELDEFTWTLI